MREEKGERRKERYLYLFLISPLSFLLSPLKKRFYAQHSYIYQQSTSLSPDTHHRDPDPPLPDLPRF
jgi:hypothetical protein